MLAGHADIGTTANIYAHLDTTDLEAALKSFRPKPRFCRDYGGGGNRTRVAGRLARARRRNRILTT
jgi:hypothetical protein